MKKFCVLQVTPSTPNQEHVKCFSKNPDCDFYFVTHDEQHEEALDFCPQTTWTDTRNILAAKVPKNYEYYAFVDYDYNFRPLGNLNPRDQILEDLNEYNPAVLTYYPGNGMITPYAKNIEYRDSRESSIIPFSHCGMKVIHHSLLNWFFPMITKFGGGVEACHLFNILEIPFLRYVVCSHKMVYDNGNTDFEAPHNQDGAWNDYRMNEMWKWIRPAFKRIDIIDKHSPNEKKKYNSMLIKEVFQNIAKNGKIPVNKNKEITNFFDKSKIEKFFDLQHEHFDSIDVDIGQQLSDVSSEDFDKVDKVLSKVSFKDLITNTNPWIDITKEVNKNIKTSKKLTTSECVARYQKINNNSLFYKSCNTDQRLKEYLSGKKVAFVGPSPYLNGQNKGREIDSYDIVVRIQHDILNVDDYGSRSDIIQSCLNSNYGPPLVNHLKNVSEDKKPKFIICNDTASELKDNGQWAFVDEVYEPIFKEMNIPLIHLKNEDGTWDRWALYWEIYAKQHIEKFAKGSYTTYSANFNSGYGALNVLMSYPLDELAVFGVDFYNTGIPQTNEQKYNQTYINTYGDEGRHLGPDKILHDQISQIMHCKNVLLKDKRFKLDQVIYDKIMNDDMEKRIDKFIQLPKFKNETR